VPRPAAPLQEMLASAVSILQLAALALVFAGDALLPALGLPHPDMLRRAAENKFGTCMAVWFIGNMLSSTLLTTNAFEIYANGELVGGTARPGWHRCCRDCAMTMPCSDVGVGPGRVTSEGTTALGLVALAAARAINMLRPQCMLCCTRTADSCNLAHGRASAEARSPVSGPCSHTMPSPSDRARLLAAHLWPSHPPAAPLLHLWPSHPPAAPLLQLFSKLAAGRLPSKLELVDGLVAALGPAAGAVY
jgi:hypothetical protein